MTIHWHFEKSSPQTVVTGESDQSAGSHGAVTKYNSGAENVIRLPVLSSLPANSELPSGAPFSILDQDRIAHIVLSVLVGIVLLASGLMMFAGHLLFGFFDLG